MRAWSAMVFSLALLTSTSIGAHSSIAVSSISTPDTLALPHQQTSDARALSGAIVTSKNELVPGVSVIVRSASGEQRAVSDA